MRFDVAVIGAGIVGSLVALKLARLDLRVALIEAGPDLAWGATRANSGIVHAGFASSPGTLMARLCVEGNKSFERLGEELKTPFKRIGSLVCSKAPSEHAVLSALKAQGEANGVEGLEIWDQSRLRLEEPNIEAFEALFAPSAGIVSPYELCFRAVRAAVSNGVSLFLNAPVSRASIGIPHRLMAGHEEILSSFVVNAAGLQADEVASLAGDDFALSARKGEYILLDRSEGSLVRRVVFPLPTKTSKGILLTPTVGGNLLLGPTASSCAKGDTGTTREGLGEVYEKTKKLLPRLERGKIIATFAGLRAVGSKDFEISFSKQAPNWLNLIGIQSPGLTSAPAIAEEVLSLLEQAGLRGQKKDFFFPEKPASRADRVICRCEGIGRSEILQAIRDGATTLDGVKLRTRASMGRCQGGSCRAGIAAILAEELGIPLEAVMKRGAGSPLLDGISSKGAPG